MLEELRKTHELAWGIGKRILMLLGPIAACGLLLVFFWFVFPPPEGSAFPAFSPQFIVLIGLLIAYLVPPFGKETIIPAALIGGAAVAALIAGIIGMPIDPAEITGFPLWVVVLAIVGMDIAVAAFITFNFDLLLKIPFIGNWLRWIMRGADNIIQSKKWIRDLSSAGLLLFMYIPLQGSGAMTTSVIARLLNYPPMLAIGLVTIGSLISSLTVGLGISSIIKLWEVNPLLAVLEVVAIIGFICLVAVSWSKIVRKIGQMQNKK